MNQGMLSQKYYCCARNENMTHKLNLQKRCEKIEIYMVIK